MDKCLTNGQLTGSIKKLNFATSIKAPIFDGLCNSQYNYPKTPSFEFPVLFLVFISNPESVPGSGPGTERYSGNKPKFEKALKRQQK